jgi:hypothetical protein
MPVMNCMNDGLPVLSTDGHHIQGWATSADVLSALARQITGVRDETTQAQGAADRDYDDTGSPAQRGRGHDAGNENSAT